MYWLKNDFVKSYLKYSATKTAQPALSLSKIKKLPILLPPLDEQKKIISILEAAENIIIDFEKNMPEVKNLTKSIFSKMFGDIDL